MPRLLSQHVRGVYFDYRRQYDNHPIYRKGGRVRKYDGGIDSLGNVCQPFWPTLVRHFVQVEAEPNLFIRAQFMRSRLNRTKVPLPPDLLEDEARQAYLSVIRDEQRQMMAQMQWETDAIRCEARIARDGMGWTSDKAMSHALGVEIGMNVNPLLRYCLAVEHGAENIATRHHELALLHYVFQRSFYDRGEACHVPDCLRSEGAVLVERLCSVKEE